MAKRVVRTPKEMATELHLLAGSVDSISRDLATCPVEVMSSNYADYVVKRIGTVESTLSTIKFDVQRHKLARP